MEQSRLGNSWYANDFFGYRYDKTGIFYGSVCILPRVLFGRNKVNIPVEGEFPLFP